MSSITPGAESSIPIAVAKAITVTPDASTIALAHSDATRLLATHPDVTRSPVTGVILVARKVLAGSPTVAFVSIATNGLVVWKCS